MNLNVTVLYVNYICLMYFFQILMLFFFSSALFAQNIQRCHFDEIMQRYKNSHPEYINPLNQKRSEANTKKRNSFPLIATIPVVVHIVYKTTEQNISDNQIYSQFDVLNSDYSKQNISVAICHRDIPLQLTKS